MRRLDYEDEFSFLLKVELISVAISKFSHLDSL